MADLIIAPPVRLTAEHDTSSFDCGDAALNLWLQRRAMQNESRFARTYATCEGNRVAGYYCILAGAVDRAAAPGKLRRNAPEVIPVSIVGRLAVDKVYKGHGLGAALLADALERIALAAQTLGIAGVIVHAKSDEAKRFYAACAEFIEHPAESRILFLPMETITG